MRCLSLVLCYSIATLLGTMTDAAARADERALRVGDPAPDFSAINQENKQIRLSGYRGQFVVLTFNRAHW